jgi:hypothetical protein
MFRKLNPAAWEWQDTVAIGGFLFTLAVFLFFFLRALRIRKDDADRLSRLPVDQED